MSGCHEMKKGDVYTCEGCGMELQVVKECEDHGKSNDCCCHGGKEKGDLLCCEKPLTKKS